MNQAVISGVNDYQYAPYDRLRGCVNDAQNFNLLAQNYLGFAPDDVTLLLDSAAMAYRIKNAVVAAVTRAKPGDHILWTHSSHGTNSPDPTQADGLEELLCCYDTREKDGDWDKTTVIAAKFIGDVITQLPLEANMDIILDCCYAPDGGQLKSMGLSYSRARFLRRTQTALGQFTGKTLTVTAGSKMPSNVCLWSACESSQTSADDYIDGKWQGAFSAAWRKFFKPGRSRSDIIYSIRKWLKDNRYAQVPHLYGVGLAWKPVI